MTRPRSASRILGGALALGLFLAAGAATPPARADETTQAAFARFVEGLWPAARAKGVSRATFDQAFEGVSPDPRIVALTKKQSEFVRPIWDYINGSVSAQRLERGRAMAAEWDKTLDAVERA